jgi:ketosteroid isomerase-like protein
VGSDNEDLVRRAFTAATASPPDVATLLEVYTDDHLLTTDWGAGDGRSYIGFEGYRQALADTDEAIAGLGNEVLDVVDAGEDRVIAVLRSSGRGRVSGLSVDREAAAVVTVRGGRIAATRYYTQPEEAFEAVGLDPPPAP